MVILLLVVIPCILNASKWHPIVARMISLKLYKQPGHINPEPRKGDRGSTRWRSSQDLIVRSVYLDRRPRYGYRNASVFMLEVRKTIVFQKLILGCQVGNRYTTNLKVRPLMFNGRVGYVLDNRPSLTHTMAVVDCYDLPAKNGSDAFILYKASLYGMVIPAKSERRYAIPATPPASRFSGNLGIIACTTIYGQPPFLKSWLLHQKTLRVDHVHIIAENSFQDRGGLQEPYMRKAIKEGFVSVDVWESRLGPNELEYHSQLLKYQDCIYRFRGTYDYMFLVDQDDFFVSLVPNQSSLYYFIDNWCYKGACAFHWRLSYCNTECLTEDGNYNISRFLVPIENFYISTKSLYRLSAVLEVGIHHAMEFLPGFTAVKVPKDRAFTANVRMREGNNPIIEC